MPWSLGLSLAAALVLAAQAGAQAPLRHSGPTLTLGLGSGNIQSTCPLCGSRWSRGTRTLVASLDWSLAGVHGALAVRGILCGTTRRRLSAVTLSFEAMPLRRWLRIGAGLGGGGYRDSVLTLTPGDSTVRATYVTALAPMAEFHIAAAIPISGHVELGPVVGYVTSLGGLPAFTNSNDRAVAYAGLQLALH